MKTIGIFYGSSTGNTQAAAEKIGGKLGLSGSDVKDIGKASVNELQNYDILFLGSSTWGIGDLQDDWEAVIEELRNLDLNGKKVAVFGTGDSISYSDSFCDAIGVLADAAQQAGAQIVGDGVETYGYNFDESQAKSGDTFVGLPLDYDNEDDKTEGRISAWVARIKEQCGI